METGTQARRPRFARAVGFALVASLAVFAFFPGSVLAAGTVTASSAAGTNCGLNQFNWTISLSGYSDGEVVLVDATFGSVDSLFGWYPVPGGSLDISWPTGGTTADTLQVTVVDSTGGVQTATATPNCAPAMPTSKSECDGDGWAAFPAFKNRGQCVAFVSRGK